LLKHKQLLQGDPKLTKPLALSMFNTFYYLLFCVILGKCRIQVFLKVWPCWPQGPFETATIFSEYRGGPIFCSNVLAYFDRGSKASFYNILRDLWKILGTISVFQNTLKTLIVFLVNVCFRAKRALTSKSICWKSSIAVLLDYPNFWRVWRGRQTLIVVHVQHHFAATLTMTLKPFANGWWSPEWTFPRTNWRILNVNFSDYIKLLFWWKQVVFRKILGEVLRPSAQTLSVQLLCYFSNVVCWKYFLRRYELA